MEDFGGLKECQAVNREIAKYVDVMIGNEEDFSACLGFEVEGVGEHLVHRRRWLQYDRTGRRILNLKATATTLRCTHNYPK